MKKALALVLALVMVLSFAACGGGDSNTSPSPSETPSTAPSSSVEPSQNTEPSDTTEPSTTPAPEIAVGFLKGPTGMGAAYLMEQNSLGETSANYTVALEADASAINSAFIAGDLDIVAVPTNVASVLYNKMEGNVRIIAINTMSVLKILEKGDTVNSVEDLRGKKIYATGQGSNPEYVLNYILRENGLEPGTDVEIEFMDSAELATQMAAGEIDLCMLPVPNATSVLIKNQDVRVALDMGELWDATENGSTLTQGCMIVRADLEDLETKVAVFLEDYKKSVDFMTNSENIEEACALAEKYEIVGSAAIAKAAIPDCGITLVYGSAEELKEMLDGYYNVLINADATSVGGAVPNDDFYYNS